MPMGDLQEPLHYCAKERDEWKARALVAEAEVERLRDELRAWEETPTFGMGYADAEDSFRPLLERMAGGLTKDGVAIEVGQMRLMATEALRQLDDSDGVALSPSPPDTEEH